MSSADLPVISVRNVSKRYVTFDNQRARLRHVLTPSRLRGVSETWALHEINLDVMRGESVGIIGRNGAGKSSLLQIITRTLTPTSGTVAVNGRVAALLELGSGFNPEYSGRENVMLNGLLFGLSRDEVIERFDAIASFADIGDVLDSPVKTYSSGMMMRLAFAVQVALEPDVLIVDEALSVGDYFFQQKCFGRLRKMRDQGLTLLFVSHDMGTVRDTCERVLYLDKGRQIFLGDAQEATRKYLADGRPASDASPVHFAAHLPVIARQSPELQAHLLARLAQNSLWSCAPQSTGRLLAVHIMNEQGDHVSQVALGGKMVLRVSFRAHGSGLPLAILLMFKNKYDQIIFSTGTRQLGVAISDACSAGVAVFEFELDMMLEAGLYSCKVVCTDQSSGSDVGVRESSGWIGPVQISWNYEEKQPPFFGMFGLPVRSRGLSHEPEELA
ncbi:MAG: hypothetical protein JWM03_688 [Rhodocyclales bacterium]|nr:hypothetical protein [Rhodocyclales bacterium]